MLVSWALVSWGSGAVQPTKPVGVSSGRAQGISTSGVIAENAAKGLPAGVPTLAALVGEGWGEERSQE